MSQDQILRLKPSTLGLKGSDIEIFLEMLVKANNAQIMALQQRIDVEVKRRAI